MKKHGIVYIIAALVLLTGAAVLFGVLYGAASEGTPKEPVRVPSITPAASGEEQTRIQLSANGVEVDGPGASVSGSTLAISRAGAYFVNGVLAGGQIRVDAGDDDTVILVLNGVELSNATQAAIYVENAGLTQLVLTEGSVNSVQSGAPTERLVADESASGGAIYARDDLAITGTGSLRVFGYINNGVQTANDLSIDSGHIEITALNGQAMSIRTAPSAYRCSCLATGRPICGRSHCRKPINGLTHGLSLTPPLYGRCGRTQSCPQTIRPIFPAMPLTAS